MHRFVLIIVVALLTGLPVQAQSGAWEKAINNMARDPDAAEAVLRGADDSVARLDLLLFLHAFRPAGENRDIEIRNLKGRIDKAALEAEHDDKWLFKIVGAPLPYDGSDESLIATIILAKADPLAAYYAIPCAVLVRRPGLLEATQPLFGSSRDNFLPRSGCQWGRGTVEGYPEAVVRNYLAMTELADGDFIENHRGTIRYAHMGALNLGVQAAMLSSDSLPPVPEFVSYPYETWSYMSLANRRVYAAIGRAFDSARNALLAYWTGIGKSADDAAAIARKTLFSIPFGTLCGEGPPEPSLRKLLIDDAPLADIRAMLEGNDGADGIAIENCAKYAGIDPLIHIAVSRPDTLPVLFRDRRSEDVDAPNEFGKTPLMTAAQINNLESVEWLLAHGADVNAATQPTDEWEFPQHGQRTALHYAAANAGLSVIRALIDAGGDVNARDDEGASVSDYLLGKGPVAENDTLSKAGRREAIRLLSGRP